jgi:hypothetical protein
MNNFLKVCILEVSRVGPSETPFNISTLFVACPLPTVIEQLADVLLYTTRKDRNLPKEEFSKEIKMHL